MRTDIGREIEKFYTDFGDDRNFNDSRITKLLDKIREALDLDVVYVLNSLTKRHQFYYAYYSLKFEETRYDRRAFQMSDDEYRTLLHMYDEERVCDQPVFNGAGGMIENILHYGFISQGIYLGALGFVSKAKREWTLEEREILKKAGRAIQVIIYFRKAENQAALIDQQTVTPLENLYCSTYNVSLEEDYYQAVQVGDRMRHYISVSGTFSKMIKQYIKNFVEPEFKEELSQCLRREYICARLTAENNSYDMDFKWAVDGEVYWYRCSVILIDRTPEGKVNHILLAMQDITEQTQEKELSERAFSLMRRGYYRIAFIHLNRNSMISLQIVRSETEKQSAFQTDYGRAIIEFANTKVLPAYRKGFLDIMRPENMQRILDSGAPYIEYIYQRYVDDKVVWVRTEVVPLEDYSPENARVMWYVRNIAEEKAKEIHYQDKLLEANLELQSALSTEKQYHMALLADSFFYFTFDVEDGMIREEFRTKDGFDPIGSVTGMKVPIPFEIFCQKWQEQYHPVFDKKSEENAFTLSFLKKTFERGERIIDMEVKQEPPEGSGASEYMQIFIVLSEDEATGHIMACMIWKDVSEFRSKEIQSRLALNDAYELANQANQAKTDFLSRMSHDIRTPMNAIIGMTAIAGTHLNEPERVADCLSKITASSKHLLSLINEVLDMSKIESGKVDLVEEEFVLSELIDDLLLLIRPQTKAKGHELIVKINDVKHEKVIGDALRLQQCFVNLMSNAVKYTPEGGRIELVITEKPCRQPQFALFEFVFQDNGIGMTKEFVDQIFEPFARANDDRVSKIQGTGLGMPIARNLVRMMNGNIKVESELGKGSRFIVTIFLKQQEEEITSNDEFIDLPVLIADDDQDSCEAACCILEDLGMKGEWVLTGEEAVEKTAARHEKDDDYFAVILDWKMPGMDGVETTREIRKQVGKDVPIIIISAYDWSDIELEAREAGADAFIGKPLFKSRFAYLFHDLLTGEKKSVSANGVEEIGKQDFSGGRILLVEDNELNAEIAEEILKMAKLEVEHVENGQIAVNRFLTSEQGYYSLIFMDIQMPVMNGYDAARAIRALPHPDAKRVPIVAMTANAFTEDVETALEAGMNEHIPKPLDFNQLVKTLNRWL